MALNLKAILLVLLMVSTFLETCLCCNESNSTSFLEKCAGHAKNLDSKSCCLSLIDDHEHKKGEHQNENNHQTCKCAHIQVQYLTESIEKELMPKIPIDKLSFIDTRNTYLHLYQFDLLRPPQDFI